MIEFKNYFKDYKNFKLGPINVHVQAGKTTAILGLSGSGKSIMINSIIGSIKKYKGDILINDISRKKSGNHVINKLISFYTQIDFSMYELTGWEF
ncbi:ABC transporter ATP-binding protein [Spiroplasma clarkii]|uniref:ATP-binding cassette domain-containing protein n=1 Tax=Spiroplasma clarkii TaxID=2139 RepID=UPI000B56847A|nr:ATP-binding cassette domain-containing protein [Spiroplasma clarkii]ARU91300.1 ABC transporter ATP-binding protein [Spiroplasma clarkii]